MTATRAGILDGIRVLDLTRFLSGPQATLFLAGLGAEVIRIDEPSGDPTAASPPFLGPKGISLKRQTPDDLGIAYLKRSRGKKSITLNLKAPEGHDLFMRLVDTADILVENFRVGVTDRLGISWSALHARNERLIHCGITGYGADGPDASRKAFDLMVQAAAGLMSITGAPDSPPSKTGASLTDGIAGTFALSGILGALFERERSGLGQSIDVSMADCLVSLLYDEPFDVYGDIGLDLRQGNRIARFSPFNTFPTNDGTVALGAATPRDWTSLLTIMGRDDLLASPDHMDVGWRLAHNTEIEEIVAAWSRMLSTEEALAKLTEKDIPCSPVRQADALTAWAQIQHRGMLGSLAHPTCATPREVAAPGFPIKLSASRTGYGLSPLVGQHNDEIYRGVLRLSERQLTSLSERGVI